jgi:tetratricopeptide (TPR) repeat protein
MLQKDIFLKNLKDIERLLRGNQYSKALLIVNKLLEKYPFSTRLLLLKGRLIQLLDEESELGELQDALDALELASELDDGSIDALNELAMFRHVMEDKQDEAILLFEKSIAKCFELLEEAYLGKAKCLFETDRVFESLNCLPNFSFLLEKEKKSLIKRKEKVFYFSKMKVFR